MAIENHLVIGAFVETRFETIKEELLGDRLWTQPSLENTIIRTIGPFLQVAGVEEILRIEELSIPCTWSIKDEPSLEIVKSLIVNLIESHDDLMVEIRKPRHGFIVSDKYHHSLGAVNYYEEYASCKLYTAYFQIPTEALAFRG